MSDSIRRILIHLLASPSSSDLLGKSWLKKSTLTTDLGLKRLYTGLQSNPWYTHVFRFSNHVLNEHDSFQGQNIKERMFTAVGGIKSHICSQNLVKPGTSNRPKLATLFNRPDGFYQWNGSFQIQIRQEIILSRTHQRHVSYVTFWELSFWLWIVSNRARKRHLWCGQNLRRFTCKMANFEW